MRQLREVIREFRRKGKLDRALRRTSVFCSRRHVGGVGGNVDNSHASHSEAATEETATERRCYSASLRGYVGRRFATTMNPIPIAMVKKEKNCPRVNIPTRGASGSRKFSTMIRKTE